MIEAFAAETGRLTVAGTPPHARCCPGAWSASEIGRRNQVIDERAVEMLIERQAVEDVLYRYASSIDQKDYAALRSVLADDIVGQYSAAPEIRGGDALVQWIEEMSVSQGFQHHLVNVYQVDLDLDQGEARALTYHTSHQVRPSHPDTVLLIVGRYRDQLRREDGTWKIVDKRMEVGWIEERHHSQATALEQEMTENLAAQERSGGTP
jgi:3-phenylpropionate/cinnamic acid dioxygenase small subunit